MFFFFCVGVVYSGEYDICDVTLSVHPHRASLKNMPGHGGNRTYDVWNTSPMLCQLSYAVRTVRVSDISEQNLVPKSCFKSYFNKWKKLSIGIDFGIGIDQNSWYRTGIVSKPKKLVSPITNVAY